ISDREGSSYLTRAASSELNVLTTDATGERVHLTSLDLEDERRGWRSPDFIKIDAEGEEEKILSGGKSFFAKHSPLVLFEIKAGATTNCELIKAVERMGYKVYRLLGGRPLLVPFAAGAELDEYELNLFAAKPDRSAKLAAAGLLVDEWPRWVPDQSSRARAI